jgi:uncharacterized protein
VVELFGVSPFGGFTEVQVAAIVLLYLVAFFLKGMLGYGAVAALVAGGSLIIPPHHAVVLAAVANAYTQVQFVPSSLREGDRQVALRLVFWTMPAVAAGVWLFAQAGAPGLSLLIGLMILALVVAEVAGLFRRLEPVARRHQRTAGPVVAGTAGLVGGIIGAGAIVLLSLYVRMLCPEKLRFRGTILLIGNVFVFWRLAVLALGGLVGAQVLVEALLLAPVSLTAGWLGGTLVRRLPAPLFFRLYQALLIAAALLLIARGVAGL